MRPVWYRSKCADDNPNHSHWGLIAEELADIDPRFVNFGYDPENDYDFVKTVIPEVKDEDGNVIEEEKENVERVLKVDAIKKPISIQYDKLTVFLIAEMKKLKEEINNLKEGAK